jgi:hypothetical protein
MRRLTAVLTFLLGLSVTLVLASPAQAAVRNHVSTVSAFSSSGMHTGSTRFEISDYGRKSGGFSLYVETSMSINVEDASCVARILKPGKLAKQFKLYADEYTNSHSFWTKSVILKNGTYKIRVTCRLEDYYGPETMVMASSNFKITR